MTLEFKVLMGTGDSGHCPGCFSSTYWRASHVRVLIASPDFKELLTPHSRCQFRALGYKLQLERGLPQCPVQVEVTVLLAHPFLLLSEWSLCSFLQQSLIHWPRTHTLCFPLQEHKQALLQALNFFVGANKVSSWEAVVKNHRLPNSKYPIPNT
jgi:hypothetical protein